MPHNGMFLLSFIPHICICIDWALFRKIVYSYHFSEYEYQLAGTLQSARIIQHAYNFNNVMQEFIQSKEGNFHKLSHSTLFLSVVTRFVQLNSSHIHSYFYLQIN